MIGIIGTLGLTGILGIAVLTGVAIVCTVAAVIGQGVQIYQQSEAQDAASDAADDQALMQEDANKDQAINGWQMKEAAKTTRENNTVRAQMQAGSAVKINEFATKRAELKTAMHHDKIRENLHLRASRPTGNPHLTRSVA